MRTIGSLVTKGRPSWTELSGEDDEELEMMKVLVVEDEEVQLPTVNHKLDEIQAAHFLPGTKVFWTVKDEAFGQSGEVLWQTCFGMFLTDDVLVRFRGFAYHCVVHQISFTDPKKEKHLWCPPQLRLIETNSAPNAEMASEMSWAHRHHRPFGTLPFSEDIVEASYQGEGRSRAYGRSQRRSRIARLLNGRRRRVQAAERRKASEALLMAESLLNHDSPSDYLMVVTFVYHFVGKDVGSNQERLFGRARRQHDVETNKEKLFGKGRRQQKYRRTTLENGVQVDEVRSSISSLVALDVALPEKLQAMPPMPRTLADVGCRPLPHKLALARAKDASPLYNM